MGSMLYHAELFVTVQVSDTTGDDSSNTACVNIY